MLARITLGCLALLAAMPAMAADKPNIVLIASDNFGYGDAGTCGGGPDHGMPTPGLDAWRTRGCPPNSKALSAVKSRGGQPRGSLPLFIEWRY